MAAGVLCALAAGLMWGLAFVASAVIGIGFPLPLGTTPERVIGLMLVIGLLASWLGTLCWNEASQRLPTALEPH